MTVLFPFVTDCPLKSDVGEVDFIFFDEMDDILVIKKKVSRNCSEAAVERHEFACYHRGGITVFDEFASVAPHGFQFAFRKVEERADGFRERFRPDADPSPASAGVQFLPGRAFGGDDGSTKKSALR